jgi:hypothetical protein
MAIAGLLVAVWGLAVLGLARPLHDRWREMLEQMRRDGVENTIPGTRFFASPEGLRTMRRVGAVSAALGVALTVAGLVLGR